VGAANTLEERKRYLVRRIRPGEAFERLLDFPSYFEIETVNACNARCPMCTIAEWTRHTPTMKDDLFDKIAREILANAHFVKRVALFRDGEPLLDKKLARRVGTLIQGGVKEVNICTNVSLLTPERSAELLEAGLNDIVLSIDGTDKETFEKIRVRLNFEEVVANACEFIRLRDAINPAARIRVRMVRQALNRDQWPGFERFWRPRLRPHDRVYYSDIHNWGDQLASYQPVSLVRERSSPCVALWSLMTIFADGDVPMCNIDFNNRHPTGNVREHSIREVWQNSIQNERRRTHIEGRRGDIDMCANCTVWALSDDQAGATADVAALS
jgi:radical SAM protein with 4Fe4S-binding SPASM domain